MKKRLAIITVLGSLGIGVALALPALTLLFCPAHRGAVADSWELPGGAFDLRIDRHYEACGGFVPGAYYVFRARRDGSEWREVVAFRHDDPVAIPSRQVIVVNEQVAYFYVGWVCAVTSDGAQSWSVWDASWELPGTQCCSYGLIKEVHIDGEGRGVPRSGWGEGGLFCNGPSQHATIELHWLDGFLAGTAFSGVDVGTILGQWILEYGEARMKAFEEAKSDG